jgi:hypothetical protein
MVALELLYSATIFLSAFRLFQIQPMIAKMILSWVVVADPPIRQTMPNLFRAGEVLAPHPGFRMWTDDFASLWEILN